ncbi:MAG: hypothetical protein AAF600_14685 [Bacteroidota bacterium]
MKHLFFLILHYFFALSYSSLYSQGFFYAGNHKITVISLTNDDPLSFAGTGRVNLPDPTTMTFSNLELVDNGGFYVVNSGVIVKENETVTTVSLTPQLEGNVLNPSYQVSEYRLNKNGLYAVLDVEFQTPIGSNPFVFFAFTANYNSFDPIGVSEVYTSLDIPLTDKINLKINPSSLCFMNNDGTNDIIRLQYDGTIAYPDTGLEFEFSSIENLTYFTSSNSQTQNIEFSDILNFYIDPGSYVFDFDENQSPRGFSKNQNGVYLLNYTIVLNTLLNEDFIIKRSDLRISSDSTAFIDNGNLLFYRNLDSAYVESVLFGLDAIIDNISIGRNANGEEEFSATGEIKLPLDESMTAFSYYISSKDTIRMQVDQGGTFEDLIFPIVTDTITVEEMFVMHWIDTSSNPQHTVLLSTDDFATVEKEYQTENDSLVIDLNELTPLVDYSVKVVSMYTDGSISESNALELESLEVPLSADNPNSITDKFSIYPNPTKSKIHFSNFDYVDKVNAHLSNLNGEVLLSVENINFVQLEELLNEQIIERSSRIYLLKIYAHGIVQMHKIIVN